MSKTFLFQAIQFKYYHSVPEWTWEQWQWRGVPHSRKLQHDWNLTIRSFIVISKTLIGGGVLRLCRGQSNYSTAPADWKKYVYLCIYNYIYIYMYMYIYIYIYISVYIYTYVCTYIHFHIHTYIYLYSYAYVYIYTHTHTHTYIYIYIYTNRERERVSM